MAGYLYMGICLSQSSFTRGARRACRRIGQDRIGVVVRTTSIILNSIAPLADLLDRAAADRHFAESAGDIEDVMRLAKARQHAAQGRDNVLAVGDRRAEMARALGQIAVVQVVGFYSHFDERA